jgi:hypothetical protein
MARRAPYTRVVKNNELRAAHVKGEGDRLYRLVSCLGLECQSMFRVAEDDAQADKPLVCPTCGFKHQRGTATKFADYELMDRKSETVLGAGPFEISHDAFLDAAPVFKFCIICSTLQPADNFDRHAGRKSGLQGECRVCKQAYNEIKNGSRLPEQHREAADYRRLMVELAQDSIRRLDAAALYATFGGSCFNCKKQLVKASGGPDGYYIDHTLPAKYLWPVWAGPTLLCRACNGSKADKWPSAFYKPPELRALAVLTGIDYAVLAGPAQFNPTAVEYLCDNAETVLERWIAYPDRLTDLRQKVYDSTGTDVFASAKTVPASLDLHKAP